MKDQILKKAEFKRDLTFNISLLQLCTVALKLSDKYGLEVGVT
jgi:hypothetical protein